MKNEIILKRIKELMGILLIIFFVIFKVGMVYADEVSNLQYEKIEGIYSYVKRGDSVRLFYLKIFEFEGKPAYCIELGEDIIDNKYFNTIDYNSFGFTKDQIDYINLLSYYGYEYPGHNDYRYYMATQELIWEYLEGIDIYWTYELNKNSPSKINIDNYLQEIRELVMRHNMMASIDSVYEYYVGDYIELVDSNNVLNNYYIVSDDGLGAVIEGNKIFVPNNGDKVGNFNIKLKERLYTNDASLIYYNDSSQMLFSMKGIKSNEIDISLVIKGARMVLNKYDSESLSNSPMYDGSLSGAIYGLYNSDGELLYKLCTDEYGQAMIDGLIFGDYMVKELEASYGYRLDETVYYITIDKIFNELIVYEENDLKLVELYKTFGNDYKVEMNVSFDVLKENGEFLTTIVTDEFGYASILLPYGSYIFRQINSKEGYKKVEDFVVEISQDSKDVLSYYLNDEIEEIVTNPKTYDCIGIYIVVFGISIGVLILGIIYIMVKYIRVLLSNRGGRKILFVIIGLLLIFLVNSDYVMALEQGKMSYVSLENYYIVGVDADKECVYFDHSRIYRFNDISAYLVNLSRNYSSNSLYYKNYNVLDSGFTKDQVEYINLIAYYGYEYELHNDNVFYYMASQEMILEYLYDYNFYWTDQFSAKGREIDISLYKDEIGELISKHYVLPSFSEKKYTYFVGNNSEELIDEHNVLDNYYIVSDDGLGAKIIDNKLIIENIDLVGEYEITLRRGSYIDRDNCIYYKDGCNMFYLGGDVLEDEVNVYVMLEGASLELVEKNDYGYGDGVYELYDEEDNLIYNINTLVGGKAKVSGLSLGNYKLKVVSSCRGCQESLVNVHNILIDDPYNVVEIYNEVIKKEFNIFIDLGNDNVLDEILIFDIYDSSGEYVTSIEIMENGVGSVFLCYGEYEFIQRVSLEDYYDVDNFRVFIDEDSDESIGYNLGILKRSGDLVIDNPKTLDNIYIYFMGLLGSGCMFLVVIYVFYRKCYNNKREGDFFEN